MSIINNALSGSLAAQMALDVASQNIANLKTVGLYAPGRAAGGTRPERQQQVRRQGR